MTEERSLNKTFSHLQPAVRNQTEEIVKEEASNIQLKGSALLFYEGLVKDLSILNLLSTIAVSISGYLSVIDGIIEEFTNN